MKTLLFNVFLLFNFLWVNSRVIGDGKDDKILEHITNVSRDCAFELESKLLSMPSATLYGPLPEDNKPTRQMYGCMFLKYEIVDRENHVNKEKFRQLLLYGISTLTPVTNELSDMIDELNNSCSNVEGPDYQYTAVRLQNCVNNIMKEKFVKCAMEKNDGPHVSQCLFINALVKAAGIYLKLNEAM